MNSVLILNFGTQYVQLIARKIRELSVYCEIVPFNITIDEIKNKSPKAIIFSGGPASTYAKFSPKPDPKIYELGIPILGICYGLQLMVEKYGGKVTQGKEREFGRAMLTVVRSTSLLENITNSTVWMSHHDTIEKLPKEFTVTSETPNAKFCTLEFPEKKLYALQFHPEVNHSEQGKKILANFVFKIANIEADWKPEHFIENKIKTIQELCGKEKVICAISGGVDSSVAATLVGKAIGKKLTCVFVDNGLLRKNEAREVKESLSSLGLKLKVVNASALFLKKLQGVTDPEKKRKIIGKTFIEVFENQIHSEKFLVQGTLYPDVIESSNFHGPSQTIKTHHNVGGLPKRMKLVLFEPFRELFKDEVRLIGAALGVPEQIVHRHPFPGPGLAVRVLGAITEERLKILRDADDIFISELRKQNLYHQVWQAFAALLPIKSVGVMGDNRSYEHTIVLRSVNSTDGMTADWSKLPNEFLEHVSTRITNEVKGINRVVYDISSKPPATIEWE